MPIYGIPEIGTMRLVRPAVRRPANTRNLQMAATKTAIRIGRFTKQVTKAAADKAVAIKQAKAAATEHGWTVLVKLVYDGRWQGFALRNTARGGSHTEDYRYGTGVGRHANKSTNVGEARVYVADTAAVSGEVVVETVL
jgi:hypothetical protein